MPKPKKRREKPKGQPQFGRARVGSQTVKRWAEDGMPLNGEGQFVSTSSDDSGKPVHVATENTDLSAELKRGLSFVRSKKTDRSLQKLPDLSR
jgi:hypothetical protein